MALLGFVLMSLLILQLTHLVAFNMMVWIYYENDKFFYFKNLDLN
jgi:hypothetical protein